MRAVIASQAPMRLLAGWSLMVASTAAYDDARCSEYSTLGYCTQSDTKTYMQRHCAAHCEEGGDLHADQAADEDSACAQWALDGYCTDEKFAAYMSQNCPSACGVDPAPADDLDARLRQVVASEEEDEAAADEAGPSSPTEDRTESASPKSSSTGKEPEHCVGWARQGLCETGNHIEYMRLNCARACATTPVGSADESNVADPIRCAQWALQGLCDEDSSYATYMAQNCAEECEAEVLRDPKAGLPPPADLSMIGVLLAFGGLAYYLVRRTVVMDSERSLFVKKKLGLDEGIGAGKLNRSAVLRADNHAEKIEALGQKRSAKKMR